MVLTLLMCIACMLLCVAVHLGVLLLVYRLDAGGSLTLHRSAVGLIVLAAIVGHLLEISVFAAGYALLAPPDGGSGFDVWYHSAAAFTSLGDSRPGTRELQLMTAVEALTGLVLITWTAAFTFLFMQEKWRHRGPTSPSPPDTGLAVPAEPGGVTAAKPPHRADHRQPESTHNRPRPHVTENP